MGNVEFSKLEDAIRRLQCERLDQRLVGDVLSINHGVVEVLIRRVVLLLDAGIEKSGKRGLESTTRQGGIVVDSDQGLVDKKDALSDAACLQRCAQSRQTRAD